MRSPLSGLAQGHAASVVPPMRVFLDFEASSLGRDGYPIEVGWVFEDGRSEAHLIRPAPGWDDWADDAQAIHHISRDTLDASGEPHDHVARRMVDMLTGHDLLASAPSWDGKWLSVLLRAAGLPRHALRLRDSDEECRQTVECILAPHIPAAELAPAIDRILEQADARPTGHVPAHRALADAVEERAHWLAVRSAAMRLVGQDTDARER
jgi:hypothetical protein